MEPGTVLARHYRIEDLLGEGGMGAVFSATTLYNGMRVALKTLRSDLVPYGRIFIERLRREALAMRVVDHPHVVRVLDLVTERKRPFLTMELLSGGSLGDLVKRRGQVDATHVARIGIQLLRALRAVHRAGYVHRDVKPDNIYLVEYFAEPFAKLVDFGLVKPIGRSDMVDDLTIPGGVLGTWQYMAPEQALGQAVDTRADIYSLGACLYYALTGTRPHQSVRMDAALFASSHCPAAPLRDLCPHANDEMCMTIDRALSKDRERRWRSARVMAAALQASLDAVSVDDAATWAPRDLAIKSLFANETLHITAPEPRGKRVA